MTLSRRLLLLVLAVLLPAAGLFAWMVAAAYQRELESARQHLRETTRALALVVDRELDKRAVVAHTLAITSGLMEGDHRRFYDEARAATEGTGNWVILVDTDNQLVNTRVPFGSPLPARVGQPLEPLATGHPRVTNLQTGPLTHAPVLAVFAPVPNVTPPHFNVGVVFTPEALQTILTEQRLPAGWTAEILDAGHTIVAATPFRENSVGRPAANEMVKAMQDEPEGFIDGFSLDGNPVRAFFARSPVYGWHFLIGVPSDLLTASARKAAWTVGIASVLLAGFALALAGWSARRIREPIEALEKAAHELAADRVPSILPSGLAEADAVGAALHRAGVQASQINEELERRVASALETARQERLRSEALQRVLAEELLRLITDNLPVLISYVDRHGRYRLNNKAYETWFGEPREQFLGRTMAEALPAQWPALQPRLARAFEGEVQSFELQVDYPAAGRRWVQTHFVPHRSPAGSVEGVAVLVHDVSELRQAHQRQLQLNEELARAARRKDEFLATLAHELRNPLAPITSALQVMKLREPPDPVLRRTRDVMDRQVRQLTRLVDDLLDVARITRGRIELRRERLDAAAVVRSAVESAQPLIEGAGHALEVSLPAAPVWIDADPTRMAQVLLNLLANSAKYTPAGGCIRVALRPAQGEALLSVSDNGIGLAPEHLQSVFDMFSQVVPALDRSQGGLGIGLALARGLVELHGGRMEARSEGPGRGAEFIVHLPLASREAEDPSVPAPARPSAEPLRVLVVDDNRDAADSLSMVLSMLGHEVQVAHDGPSALSMVEAAAPDVVLLDIGMPGMNGYEVARRLRSMPAGQPLLMAALTGWGQQEDKRRAAEAGFDVHLTKPVDEASLQAVLAQASAARRRRTSPA